MNAPASLDDGTAAGSDLPDPAGSHALFAGDQGALDAATRKAIVVLLKNRFITRGSHPEEYKAIVRAHRQVRARLNELFLDLALDTEREVAYKFQVSPEGSDRFPTLLHATEWSREETILLVHLRTLAHTAHAGGDERVFVDRDDLLEHVAGMRPPTATNKALDRNRVRNALETLVSAGLLIGRKDADRWELSPAIDLLLPLETLQQLLSWVRSSGQPESSGPEDDLDADTPAPDEDDPRTDTGDDDASSFSPAPGAPAAAPRAAFTSQDKDTLL